MRIRGVLLMSLAFAGVLSCELNGTHPLRASLLETTSGPYLSAEYLAFSNVGQESLDSPGPLFDGQSVSIVLAPETIELQISVALNGFATSLTVNDFRLVGASLVSIEEEFQTYPVLLVESAALAGTSDAEDIRVRLSVASVLAGGSDTFSIAVATDNDVVGTFELTMTVERPL